MTASGVGADGTRLTRPRGFLSTQFPFALAVTCFAAFGAAFRPEIFVLPWLQAALALTIAATVLSLAVPWNRLNRMRRLVIAVPLIDLVAAAFFREADSAAFPSVSFLVIFPVIWLATWFSRRALAFVVVAVFLVFLFPFAVDGRWPQTVAELAAVTIAPLDVCILAVSVWIAARSLRHNEGQLDSANNELEVAHSASEDDRITVTAVIDTVDAAIVFFSPRGEAILWNDATRRLAERAGATVSDYSFGQPMVFGPDRTTPIDAADQIVPRALRGETLAGDIYWIGPPDEQIAVTAASRAIVRRNGVPLGTVVVAYDVTTLVEAIAVRDDFLTTISHELITPMTSILGFLELIYSGDVDTVAGLAVIQRNADRLRSVISDLVDAAGKTSVERTTVDLAVVIHDSIDAIRLQADAAGVDIRCISHPTMAEVDGAAIRQVLDNVLSNAIKFSKENGSVIVTLDSDTESALISVSDNGIGITADDQRQMFDRFFRARSSRVDAIAGTGLGLAIAKSLVDAHGGRIEVESALGEGATVSVVLPLGLMRG